MLKPNFAWRVVLACVFVSALAAGPRPASPIADGNTLYKGLGIAAGPDNAFRPCGTGKSYWLSGPQDVLVKLRETYGKTAKTAGEHLYMELRGRIGPKMQQGASAEMDGIFRVEEVIVVRTRAGSECGGGKGR